MVKTRNIFKFLLLIYIVTFYVLVCSCSMSNNTIYNTETYTINNNLNETYLIKYTEKEGFPDHSVEIEIVNGENTILSYTTQYKKEFLPQQVIYLFEFNSTQYYYVTSSVSESIFINNTTNENNFKYLGNKIDLDIDFNDSSKSYVIDYITLSAQIREHMTRQDIIYKFNSCNCDYSKIIELYNLSV